MSVTNQTTAEAAKARIEVEAGRLYDAGMSGPQIAGKLGVDVRVVTAALQRIGVIPEAGRRQGRPRQSGPDAFDEAGAVDAVAGGDCAGSGMRARGMRGGTRVRCPKCGRLRMLTKSGAIRKHASRP